MAPLVLAVILAMGFLPGPVDRALAVEPDARTQSQSCASTTGPGIPPPARVPSGIAGFHAHWYGQSGYQSLCPGERATATVAFYNSGSLGWVSGKMGEVAYLGTWGPEPGQDSPSVLGGDGQRGSPATAWPRYDRAAIQPVPYVGPGQVAWFQFAVAAPLVPGTYRLGIRPLIEGATWLEDFGVFWVVTVLNPDGSAPQVAGPPGATAIAYRQARLSEGQLDQVKLDADAVTLLPGALAGSWTSAWTGSGFGWSELIASWSATTPPGSWIRVAMQATPDGLRHTRWWELGRWAETDADTRRQSVRGQSDDDGRVDVDTFFANATSMRAYRLRVTLERASDQRATPRVLAVGAVVSDAPRARPSVPSPVGVAAGIELAVPRYSQEIHAGEYPEYDGGGEAWCSPTSTAMVMAHFGRGPATSELAEIPFADPQVDHAARHTFDLSYRGTGNWPFNTAYAARYGLRAFVTQLRSLTEAERFIAAGIPLVASISVAPGGLPGFLYAQGTNGHLLVISGFTRSGDVVANDPAALTNESVRRVYPRAAFERAWLGGSFGAVYVIHPSTVPLPATPEGYTPNW